jgi:transformation/transcription domain-associated protein
MKVVTESDAPSQINDVFNASSAESKRSVEGSTFPDDTTKRVKAEPGLQPLCVMSPGGPSSIPNIETPGSSSQPDEEFKPNAAMEEMIINFLIRVRLASNMLFLAFCLVLVLALWQVNSEKSFFIWEEPIYNFFHLLSPKSLTNM